MFHKARVEDSLEATHLTLYNQRRGNYPEAKRDLRKKEKKQISILVCHRFVTFIVSQNEHI